MTVSALFEISLLEDLIGGPGIPFYRWRGKIEDKIALATDPYGPSLEEVFQLSGRLFNAQVVALMAKQLISRLEWIHSHSFIHGQLSPFSFASGYYKWQKSQILLVKFGSVLQGGGEVKDDLISVGLILAYLHGHHNSWEDFLAKSQEEQMAKTAPELQAYMDAASHPVPCYEGLRGIFHNMYRRWELNVKLGSGLGRSYPRLTRLMPLGFQDSIDELRVMNTGDLFDTLKSCLSRVGIRVGGQSAELLDGAGVDLLRALSDILALYLELLVRDRPSHVTQYAPLHAYDLPHRFWRDIRWFLEVVDNGPPLFQGAITDKIYKFLTVLVERVPSHRMYWTQHLHSLATSKKGIREKLASEGEIRFPTFKLQAWTETAWYWQKEVSRLRARASPLPGQDMTCIGMKHYYLKLLVVRYEGPAVRVGGLRAIPRIFCLIFFANWLRGAKEEVQRRRLREVFYVYWTVIKLIFSMSDTQSSQKSHLRLLIHHEVVMRRINEISFVIYFPGLLIFNDSNWMR
jgi:serine/threonine protein kinase